MKIRCQIHLNDNQPYLLCLRGRYEVETPEDYKTSVIWVVFFLWYPSRCPEISLMKHLPVFVSRAVHLVGFYELCPPSHIPKERQHYGELQACNGGLPGHPWKLHRQIKPAALPNTERDGLHSTHGRLLLWEFGADPTTINNHSSDPYRYTWRGGLP